MISAHLKPSPLSDLYLISDLQSTLVIEPTPNVTLLALHQQSYESQSKGLELQHCNNSLTR